MNSPLRRATTYYKVHHLNCSYFCSLICFPLIILCIALGCSFHKLGAIDFLAVGAYLVLPCDITRKVSLGKVQKALLSALRKPPEITYVKLKKS